MNKFPFDELNTLKSKILSAEGLTLTKEEVVDDVLEFLIEAYLMGDEAAAEMLGFEGETDVNQMEDVIYRKGVMSTPGIKPFNELIEEYVESLDMAGILRVAETEAHRVYNASILHTALEAGATTKTWNCLFKNSRDTHEYLHGMTVDIEDEFYTYNGDHSLYPGEFGVPGEDVNCNCWLTVSK